MQRRILLSGCAVMAVAFFGLAVWFIQTEALAQPQRVLNGLLRGSYAYNMTMHCVNGSGTDAFTDYPYLLLQSSGIISTLMLQATLHYNGDGTGTVENGRLHLILPGATSPFNSPVKMNDYSCDLTYEVNPDGTFTQWLEGCTSIRIAGNMPGDIYTTDGIVVQGQISRDGKTLLLWDTDTNVEDQTMTRDSVTTYSQRICSRGGIAIMSR